MSTPDTGTFAFLKPILRCEDLDPTETLLMLALAAHVDHNDETTVGIEICAAASRCSYPTAKRRLVQLAERGFIVRTRRRRGSGNLGTYTTRLLREPLGINLISGDGEQAPDGPPGINLSPDHGSPGRSLARDHLGDPAEVPEVEVPETSSSATADVLAESKHNPPDSKHPDEGAHESKQTGNGSKHEDPDLVAAEFEQRIWRPYPPMPNGTKPSKGKALAAWRALPKTARARAVTGVKHLAAAVARGETIPKHAFRFLRRDSAGDYPFDDWQHHPPGSARAKVAWEDERDAARALGIARADHGLDEDTVRAELESKHPGHVQIGLAAYRQQRQEPAA